MKKRYIVALIVSTLIAIISFPQTAHEQVHDGVILEAQSQEELDKIKLFEIREEWLEKLIQCESGGNPNALNPMDLDGTPSHGILQFKTTTFDWLSDKYGVDGELYDPEAQKEIVRNMMDDESIIFENQFPACVRKIGTPPKSVL